MFKWYKIKMNQLTLLNYIQNQSVKNVSIFPHYFHKRWKTIWKTTLVHHILFPSSQEIFPLPAARFLGSSSDCGLQRRSVRAFERSSWFLCGIKCRTAWDGVCLMSFLSCQSALQIPGICHVVAFCQREGSLVYLTSPFALSYLIPLQRLTVRSP